MRGSHAWRQLWAVSSQGPREHSTEQCRSGQHPHGTPDREQRTKSMPQGGRLTGHHAVHSATPQPLPLPLPLLPLQLLLALSLALRVPAALSDCRHCCSASHGRHASLFLWPGHRQRSGKVRAPPQAGAKDAAATAVAPGAVTVPAPDVRRSAGGTRAARRRPPAAVGSTCRTARNMSELFVRNRVT